MRLGILLALCTVCFAQAADNSSGPVASKVDAVTYFKRASQQLAQGHEKQALSDFRRSLKADPNFVPAQYNLAATYLRLGMVEKALEQSQECQDARCAEIIEKANSYNDIVNEGPSSTDDCQFFNKLLDISPKSVDVLKQRSECLLSKGYRIEAINDLSVVVQLDPSDVQSTAKVAVAYYVLLDQRNQALQIVRRCVQYNEEDKTCKQVNRQLKELQKLLAQKLPKIKLSEISKRVAKLLKQYNISLGDGRKGGALIETLQRRKCHMLAMREKWDKAAQICAEVRDFDEEYPPAILVQAHLEHKNGNSQQALELVSKIIKDHSDSDCVSFARTLHDQILMQRRQPPPQQFQGEPQKDYYKVLGVKEDADTKQIRKAYRELSKKFHPDKYKGKDMSENEVMEKMQEINEAYEILSKKESRADYDAQRSSGGGGGGGGGNFYQNGFGGFPGGFPGGFQGFQGGNQRFMFRQG